MEEKLQLDGLQLQKLIPLVGRLARLLLFVNVIAKLD